MIKAQYKNLHALSASRAYSPHELLAIKYHLYASTWFRGHTQPLLIHACQVALGSPDPCSAALRYHLTARHSRSSCPYDSRDRGHPSLPGLSSPHALPQRDTKNSLLIIVTSVVTITTNFKHQAQVGQSILSLRMSVFSRSPVPLSGSSHEMPGPRRASDTHVSPS